MNILLLLTNSPELNSKLLLLFCLASAVMVVLVFAFMIYTATKNTKRFNKFRKKVKVGDYVNYQNRPVLIEKMDEKTATFSITVSKESLFPLDFKS